MSKLKVRRAAFKVALLASAMSFSSFDAAHAQTSAPEGGAPAENTSEPRTSDAAPGQELVVTARRVEENIQRVPVAVTVLTPTLLRNVVVTDYSTLIAQIPGYEALGGSHSSGSFSLSRVRGVTPVATYFADAPYPARQFTYNAPFFDIGNVQFLKGPQGTLFGQASNAGAELISPKRPGRDFGGYIGVDIGQGAFRSVEGALDIPITDRLRVRLAGITRHRNSGVRDVLTGRSMLDTDYNIQRLSVVFEPTDRIENYTVLQTEHVGNGTTVTNQVIGDFNFFSNATNTRQAALNGMTVQQWTDARAQILARQIELGPYRRQGWSLGCPGTSLTTATPSKVPGPNVDSVIPEPCGPGGGFVRIYSAVNTTTFELSDNFSLKNTVSHVWGKTREGLRDIDGTRLIFNESNAKTLLYVDNLPSSWSEELQLQGEVGNLDFVAGAFAYSERLKPRAPTFGAYSVSLVQSATRTDSENRSRSLYGQANYDMADLIPGLTVTGGLRKTWDASFSRTETLDPTTLAVIGVRGGDNTPSGEGHWSALSYTLSAQYQASPSTMLYINNSKGHSAGGLQNVIDRESFDPDTLNNFEAGFKTTLRPTPDLTLTANLAAYYGFYSDVKVRQAILVPVINSPNAFTTVLATTNAGKARIRGFEFDSSGTWGEWLDFNGSVAYADPYYTQYPSLDAANRPVDLSNTPFYTTPRWKFAFSPTVHMPVDKEKVGDISIGALISYRTMMWANTAKPITPTDPSNPDTGAICRLRRTEANGYPSIVADGKWAYKGCMPAFFNMNVNVTWNNPMGYEGLRATLVMTNVTGNKTPSGFDTQYDNLNVVGWQPNTPRWVHLSLQYAF